MISRIANLLKDFILDKHINNKTIRMIVFFSDTVRNLKPIIDRLGGKLESDPDNFDTKLTIEMPFDEFTDLFKESIIDDNATDDELLDAMIAFDRARKFGHGVFLRYAKEKRDNERS